MRRADQACVLKKTRELLAKVGGMPGVEVNLVRAAIDAELDGLIGWAAGQVIFQPYIDALHHAPPTRRVMSLALVCECGRRISIIPTFRTI